MYWCLLYSRLSVIQKVSVILRFITILDKGDCTSRNTVYKITCELDNCSEILGGEIYRPLNCRFDEHYRSAANPTAKSYTTSH